MISAIYALSCIAWITFEFWVTFRERGQVDTSRDRNTRGRFMFTIIAAIAIGWILAECLPYLRIPGRSATHHLIGISVIWLGLFLRFWAVRTLGRFFRTTVMIQNNHRVIQTGPYRLLRHPSYTATLILLTGVGIGMGNWLGLVLMDVMIYALALYPRIKVEEQELHSALGADYTTYASRTKRLIPFVY